MFLDEAKINIKAGDGGNGLVSFFVLRGTKKKIANGGSGGKGGDVIIKASRNVSTLYGFKKKLHFKAEKGRDGEPNNRSGRKGADLIIHVPAGTIIKDGKKIIADLENEGDCYKAAEGGIGGRGNAGFVSQQRRFPGFAEKGEKVNDFWIEFELRLLADAALVGFPNAGKSTIISRISAARPKIADYPFTTLEPNLGVVSVGDDTFVIADIPGIIEGAHEGTGLGDKFLRHVLRAKILAVILDGSVLIDKGRAELIKTFNILRKELKLYDNLLYEKDYITVVNKIDLFPTRIEIEKVKNELEKKSKNNVLLISAATGEGLKKLVIALYRKIMQQKSKERFPGREREKEYGFKTYKVNESQFALEKLDIVKNGQEYIVKNKNLERMVAMTDLENEEALQYLKYKLKKLRIGDRLKKMGIDTGSTVIIGELVFELTD
ncbi:MAG: GTPase ObgE [Actinobacteria bacterium]|nr:GTPase ObgE [Actinomycetota bacterium]